MGNAGARGGSNADAGSGRGRGEVRGRASGSGPGRRATVRAGRDQAAGTSARGRRSRRDSDDDSSDDFVLRGDEAAGIFHDLDTQFGLWPQGGLWDVLGWSSD